MSADLFEARPTLRAWLDEYAAIEADYLARLADWGIRIAPRDKVTVVIIGSSSGVKPTARATANSTESRTSRPQTATLPRSLSCGRWSTCCRGGEPHGGHQGRAASGL